MVDCSRLLTFNHWAPNRVSLRNTASNNGHESQRQQAHTLQDLARPARRSDRCEARTG